ncbi:hypothetical protein [Oryza sativa Japonica Group]|uniref:Uncharacterized protein n=2 Tax=Oryza sativa subsp. japonica TaxID=39947 RepID=Q5ZCR9_ORYSJ|nr:hypothetical protein [Oryza sativa Japonica Group]BAD53063.1 hypothetical protein [Oryza sativa Japonica Group]
MTVIQLFSYKKKDSGWHISERVGAKKERSQLTQLTTLAVRRPRLHGGNEKRHR